MEINSQTLKKVLYVSLPRNKKWTHRYQWASESNLYSSINLPLQWLTSRINIIFQRAIMVQFTILNWTSKIYQHFTHSLQWYLFKASRVVWFRQTRSSRTLTVFFKTSTCRMNHTNSTKKREITQNMDHNTKYKMIPKKIKSFWLKLSSNRRWKPTTKSTTLTMSPVQYHVQIVSRIKTMMSLKTSEKSNYAAILNKYRKIWTKISKLFRKEARI